MFAGIPLSILLAIALFTIVPRMARAPRYRPGKDWDHPPIWWTSGSNTELDPDGTAPAVPVETLGGARGVW